jgi:hypothetical protein
MQGQGKNHDKQLTFIDRVIVSGNFKTVSLPANCLVISLSNNIVSRTKRLFAALGFEIANL